MMPNNMPTENDLLLFISHPIAGVVEEGDATPSASSEVGAKGVGAISSVHSLQGTGMPMAGHRAPVSDEADACPALFMNSKVISVHASLLPRSSRQRTAARSILELPTKLSNIGFSLRICSSPPLAGQLHDVLANEANPSAFRSQRRT